jgi:hypothetical protein
VICCVHGVFAGCNIFYRTAVRTGCFQRQRQRSPRILSGNGSGSRFPGLEVLQPGRRVRPFIGPPGSTASSCNIVLCKLARIGIALRWSSPAGYLSPVKFAASCRFMIAASHLLWLAERESFGA